MRRRLSEALCVRGAGTTSKLGRLGVQKDFRNAVFAKLNKDFNIGYCLVEVDIVSCHLKILAALNLKTPILAKVLATGALRRMGKHHRRTKRLFRERNVRDY